MANADHLQVLLSGKEAWEAWRRKNYWIDPDVSGADLSKTNFDGFNLREVNFSDCNLSEAYMPRADFYGATPNEPSPACPFSSPDPRSRD